MLKSILLAAMGMALIACSSEAPAGSEPDTVPPPMPSPLDAFLDNQIDFSGVILVSEGYDPTYEFVQGTADDAGTPITMDMSWRWASVTKQMVAIAIMQEIEAGKATLDTPVNTILTDTPIQDGGTITLRHLLLHVSGLQDPDALSDADFAVFDGATYCTATPQQPPEAGFNYNNCDYWVLGRVLEALSGQDWAARLHTGIFEPAGADSVVAAIGDDPSDVKGYFGEDTPEPEFTLGLYDASAALTGTPKDLARIDAALMAGDLLGPDALTELWTGNPQIGYAALGAWAFESPIAGCDGAVRLIERRGHIYGVQARNIMIPDRNMSVIVFTNRGDFDFGEIWTGQGFSHDLLSVVLCP